MAPWARLFRGMGTNPNIRRWGLFPKERSHDAVRRYQLARLEEVALAYPVPGTEPPPRPQVEPGAGETQLEAAREPRAPVIPLRRDKAA